MDECNCQGIKPVDGCVPEQSKLCYRVAYKKELFLVAADIIGTRYLLGVEQEDYIAYFSTITDCINAIANYVSHYPSANYNWSIEVKERQHTITEKFVPIS